MSIKRIDTKVYYCNLTGNIVKIIGEMEGFIKDTSFDEDYGIYSELKERERSTIGLIRVAFGEYSKLSIGSTGVRVDLETKQLDFSYDPLPVLPEEPSDIDVIKNKIDILQTENKQLKEASKEQDKLLVDNTYKISMLEMNLGGM